MGANFNSNVIYRRDNLEVLREMNSECVDLIYLDPPWNKNDTFVGKNKKRIQEIKEWFVEQQKNGDFPDKDFEEVFKGGPSYDDIWKDSDVKDIWLSEIEGRYPDIIPYLEGAAKYTMAGGYYYLIFMAIRLIELKRILKDTGSIYLHCDPTMSHYLKGLMDIIFGKNNFRNEIVWKRHGTGGSSKAIGNIHDIILYYVKTRKAKYNPVSVPLTEKQKAEFRMSDTKGLFITNHLEAQPAMQGGGTHYTYKGYTPELGWLVSQEKLKKMDEEGYVYWTKTGKPKRKYYLHEKEGTYINDLWIDFMGIPPKSKERTGYPTQKPLKLLERIIKASSHVGDMVLDPFCGCATTCVAAENLGRQWVGIDDSELSYYINYYRLRTRDPVLQEGKAPPAIILKDTKEDLPKRKFVSDIEEIEYSRIFNIQKDILKIKKTPKRKKPLSKYEEEILKDLLFQVQRMACAGCDKLRNKYEFHLDHIKAQAQGGVHDESNRQLLCGPCNGLKGQGDMEYLWKRLVEEGRIDEATVKVARAKFEKRQLSYKSI